MAGMSDSKLLVSAVSTWNNTGIKQAQKSIGGFEKNLKNLARTVGITFSAAAVIAFGKASVNAFMADDKAIKSLGVTLRNTGNSFATDYVNQFIAGVEKVSGVLDDNLRPAFQTLLTATGSVTKAQKGLQLALDISAGTGKSLSAVSAALAKGFSGQTTALRRLGAGLSKATLASGDMNKIMAELNAKFTGQAASRATTYAGKMDALTVAANNAKETIGKGLIDALTTLANDDSLQTTVDAMASLSTYTADVVVGIADMTKGFANLSKYIPNFLKVENPVQYIPILGAYIGAAQARGAAATAKANAPTSNFTYSLGTNATTELLAIKDKKQAAKDLAAKNKLTKIENAALLAKLQLEGDARVLAELANKFDLERIGITKALSETTDAHTRTVLQSQLDILDGNAKAARADIASLEAQDAARKKSDAEQLARDALAKSASDALKESFDATAKATAKAFKELGASVDYAAAAARGLGDSHAAATVRPPAFPQTNSQYGEGDAGGPRSTTTTTPSGGAPVMSAADQAWQAVQDAMAAANAAIAASKVATTPQAVVVPAIVTDMAGLSSAVQAILQSLNRTGQPLTGSSGWA